AYMVQVVARCRPQGSSRVFNGRTGMGILLALCSVVFACRLVLGLIRLTGLVVLWLLKPFVQLIFHIEGGLFTILIKMFKVLVKVNQLLFAHAAPVGNCHIGCKYFGHLRFVYFTGIGQLFYKGLVNILGREAVAVSYKA